MTDSTIEQIKEKIDIVDLIQNYLKLQKTGINYRAPCPFHSEKKPSFFVSPNRQIFKCFGCGISGSIFDFIMKMEGIEFRDALKILAQKAGVELKKPDPKLQSEKERLYEICELASCFFERQLEKSVPGNQIQDYLLKRGLTKESIKKWRLGYAPDSWQGLSDFLVGKGYNREEIINAGLAVKKDAASYRSYDRFRKRIIFPIFDLNNQIIGFGGRIFDKIQNSQDVAKYINTPNTLLYDKTRILYGLNFGKMEIRKKDFVILTEGYIDVILSHQAKLENTVSSSGTAITLEQLKILKRYTNNLYIGLDMDIAGDLATKKGIDLAQSFDFNIKIVPLPKDTDPADIISQNPKKWQDLVKQSQDIISFYFQSVFSKFDQRQPEQKKEISKILLSKIKAIPNKILQAHWVQELAKKINIEENAIWEELKKIISTKETQKETQTISFSSIHNQENLKPKTRKDLLEERLLALILKNPEKLEFSLSLFPPKIRLILQTIKEQKEKEEIEKALKKLEKEDKNIKQILDNAILSAEFSAEFKKTTQEKEVIDEIKFCLKELKKFEIINQLQSISEEIKIAEQRGERQKVKDLLKKFSETAKDKI